MKIQKKMYTMNVIGIVWMKYDKMNGSKKIHKHKDDAINQHGNQVIFHIRLSTDFGLLIKVHLKYRAMKYITVVITSSIARYRPTVVISASNKCWNFKSENKEGKNTLLNGKKILAEEYMYNVFVEIRWTYFVSRVNEYVLCNTLYLYILEKDQPSRLKEKIINKRIFWILFLTPIQNSISFYFDIYVTNMHVTHLMC